MKNEQGNFYHEHHEPSRTTGEYQSTSSCWEQKFALRGAALTKQMRHVPAPGNSPVCRNGRRPLGRRARCGTCGSWLNSSLRGAKVADTKFA
jgi:hypothetical protein